MHLSEYIADRGAQAALARRASCHPQLVWQWARMVRPVPPERCPSIEIATDGKVTVGELRPDINWQRVPDPLWPHPDGRPCIDVAAPAREAA